jgi:RNA recognition motif-containing protein
LLRGHVAPAARVRPGTALRLFAQLTIVRSDDPVEPLAGLAIPSRTPSPTPSLLLSARPAATLSRSPTPLPDENDETKRKADATAAALTLEMVGDIAHADVRPPENILFVCKLNPVTRSEDLRLIFGRFGEIRSCEVIRDRKVSGVKLWRGTFTDCSWLAVRRLAAVCIH